MKINFKLMAAIVAVVICLCAFVSCGDGEKDPANETVTTTAENKDPVVDYSDLKIEDLYKDMTDEEIERFNKDLEELGITADDFLKLLNGNFDVNKLK